MPAGGRGAPRHPGAHTSHPPGASQRRTAEGVPRRPVVRVQPPSWLNHSQNNPVLLRALQPVVHRELEDFFGSSGIQAELEDSTAQVCRQNSTTHQCARAAVRQRSRETRRLQGQQDTHAAGAVGGQLRGCPCPCCLPRRVSHPTGPAPSSSPAPSSTDELPGTSSTATSAGSASSHPSAPVAVPGARAAPAGARGGARAPHFQPRQRTPPQAAPEEEDGQL